MRILVILISITFVSCSNSDFESIKSLNGESGSGGQCPTVKMNSSELYVSKLADKKIHLSDFQTDKFSLQSTAEVISKGTELMLLLNRACVLANKNKEQWSYLYKDKVLKTSRSDISPNEVHLYKLDSDIKFSQLESNVNQDECIIGLSPNTDLKLNSALNDPLYVEMNHLRNIGFENHYNSFIALPTLKPVVVAVIDTGNHLQHPDMVGRYWQNLAEKNGQPGVDDDNNGYIDDINGWNFVNQQDDSMILYHQNHGDHVAGLIAANANNNVGVVGLANHRVKIMALNVFDRVIPGVSQNPLVLMNQAVRYAVDNGAQVINLSMGSIGTSAVTEETMAYAVSRGVFIATSAGNESEELNDTFQKFPDSYGPLFSGLVAVAASDSDPSLNSNICVFSNYGKDTVEIVAPGCDTSIRGRWGYGLRSVYGADAYEVMPGTSMAAPLVAAAAALIISYFQDRGIENLSPSEIEEILVNGSRQQENMQDIIQNKKHLDIDVLIQYIEDNYFSDDNGPTEPPETC